MASPLTDGLKPSPRVRRFAQEFGVGRDLFSRRRFVEYEEASALVVAAVDTDGREHLLVPDAAAAWHRMRAAAAAAGVPLFIVSAFRSVERQAQIVRRKLAAGQSIEQVLTVSALPGCSEHHTGRAIDIGTEGVAVLQPEFEETPAFAWLRGHAGAFGFALSYPAGNEQGYLHEPWHWCRQAA